MNSKTIIILVVAIVAVAAVALWLGWRKTTDDQLLIAENDYDDKRATVLSPGSKGTEVKRLQQYLNTQLAIQVWKNKPVYNGKEITKLAEDGIFGNRTLEAVKWYFGTPTVTTDQF